MTINTIEIPATKILGAVLAGGQHRRMGSTPKWQLPIAGKPMIAHILERFSPQVATVIINGYHSGLSQWNYPVISDLNTPDNAGTPQGPLAGLLASLSYADTQGFNWLATCPCDAPLLPAHYVNTLTQAIDENQLCAIVSSNKKIQPVFGLWSTALIPQLQDTLNNSDLRAIGFWVKQLDTLAAIVEFDTQTHPHAFTNINTPEELQALEALYLTITDKPN